MRLFAARVGIVLCYVVTACAQAARPDQALVEGRVLNAITGEPVVKATLQLTRTDLKRPVQDGVLDYAAISDAAGKFAIVSVDPGKYRLRGSRNGFVTVEFGARASQSSGAELDLESEREMKNVEIRLTPQGVVTGRILDADGEPLERAQVQLLRWRYVDGRRTLSTVNVANTNDLGEYRWSGLKPGRYCIYAVNFNALPPTYAAREEYVPVYYPGTPDVAGAVPIEVAAGAQVRAGDLVLRKAPAAAVKGRVVIAIPDAQGTPTVRFFSGKIGHDDSQVGSGHSPVAKVDAKGGFEIRALPAGSYTAVAQIGRGGRAFTGKTTVNTAGGDVEGVVITINGGVSLTGRVRVEGDAKQNLKYPSIRLQSGGPGLGASGWTYPLGTDWTFRADYIDPGRYGIVVEGLPEGFYTKSIRAGSVDVLYSGIDLTSGPPGPIDILLSPKAGVVSGVAQNSGTTQAAAGATVVLIPKEQERLPNGVYYRQATADAYGRFVFKSVAPGDYKVYAWEDVEPTAWMDPEFMKPIEAKGEAITVGEGAQVNVQVNNIAK